MDENNVAEVVETQGADGTTVTSVVVPAGEGVYVKGEWCTPETHAWRDGGPILRVDGTAKKKPGRNGPRLVEAGEGEEAASPSKKVRQARQPRAVQQDNAAAVTHTRQAIKATVTRVFGKIGSPETVEEEIEVRTFVTPPANVEIGYGLTLNIGNYESARVDVKVALPCYREELDEAYTYAKAWAEERVRKEVADVRNLTSSKASGNSNPF